MVKTLSSLRLLPLSSPSLYLTFVTCLSSLRRFPLLGRQPRWVLYLKGKIKLILTVIGTFLFCPVYLTGFLDVYTIQPGMQSGFHSVYGCVTATLKVLNDVTIALDSKKCCAAIVIDLAKAFDTVDHSIRVGRLRSIGVSEGSLAWFGNDLSQRVQCIKSEHLLSQPLSVTKGVL
jgi:hypothetical protein